MPPANLYAAVQPGGSLFGLQESNPVDPAVACPVSIPGITSYSVEITSIQFVEQNADLSHYGTPQILTAILTTNTTIPYSVPSIVQFPAAQHFYPITVSLSNPFVGSLVSTDIHPDPGDTLTLSHTFPLNYYGYLPPTLANLAYPSVLIAYLEGYIAPR